MLLLTRCQYFSLTTAWSSPVRPLYPLPCWLLLDHDFGVAQVSTLVQLLLFNVRLIIWFVIRPALSAFSSFAFSRSSYTFSKLHLLAIPVSFLRAVPFASVVRFVGFGPNVAAISFA